MKDRFKESIILMGIDWSKAAKILAKEDLTKDNPKLNKFINDLDHYYRKTMIKA